MLLSLFSTSSITPKDQDAAVPTVNLSSILSTMPDLPSFKKKVESKLKDLLDFSAELAKEQKFLTLAREAREQRAALKKKEKQSPKKNQTIKKESPHAKKERKEPHPGVKSSDNKRKVGVPYIRVSYEDQEGLDYDDMVIKKKVEFTPLNETLSSSVSTTQSVCQSPYKSE